MFGDVAGEQPRVTTDATVGQLGVDTITEANERYAQELSNDYIITRRETEAGTSLTIPAVPNLTFHAGLRIETREGLEQARTLSKCNQCHVQANGKRIDEKTEDYTLGLTGRIGLLTVEYEYLTRNFSDNSSRPTYNYVGSGATHAGILDADALHYLGGEETYAQTPESEKDSHNVKARVDLNADTAVSATYVNFEVKSNVIGDSSYTIDSNSLSSDFESLFFRGSTRIAGLRLSARGGVYEIDGPEYVVNFPKVIGANLDPALGYDVTTGDKHYESPASREVTEFGADAVYRLTRGSTLRVGYDYEKIERDAHDLGDTTTNTVKAAVNSRFGRELSGRLSYQYQDIDDPFAGAHSGILQGTNQDPFYPGMARDDTANYLLDPGNGPGVYYWNSVYPNRQLNSTMLPEEVHEIKFASTWAPSINLAATLFARVRLEENPSVKYEKENYVPGASLFYAPNSKLNFTMAYTFNKMRTENRMCVGWYHG
jgi:predicted porin